MSIVFGCNPGIIQPAEARGKQQGINEDLSAAINSPVMRNLPHHHVLNTMGTMPSPLTEIQPCVWGALLITSLYTPIITLHCAGMGFALLRRVMPRTYYLLVLQVRLHPHPGKNSKALKLPGLCVCVCGNGKLFVTMTETTTPTTDQLPKLLLDIKRSSSSNINLHLKAHFDKDQHQSVPTRISQYQLP